MGDSAHVRFGDATLEWHADETLLDCLERGGAQVPSSCRSGVCHSCLVRALEGTPPAYAQESLKPTWREQGLFLSCVCRTPVDLTVGLADAAVSIQAECVLKELCGEDVVRLRFSPRAPFEFRAGQFANLSANVDGERLTRSYSIASLPSDGYLELHVRRVPGGRMSRWLAETLRVGDSIDVRGPSGDCFYVAGRPEQTLLLVGTGTGLAPLVGIARDALAQGHRGDIVLLHGARRARGLYLDDTLLALATAHPSFRYRACLSETGASETGASETGAHARAAHHVSGRVDAVLRAERPSLAGHRVFVCGSPAMVKDLKRHVYRAGADKDEIFADAFVAAPVPAPKQQQEAPARKSVTLRILQEPERPPETTTEKAATAAPARKTGRLQTLRFAIQALTLSGFLLQGVLYYRYHFRPLGNLLPFMAYDSLGHMVVSSALIVWASLFLLVMVFGRFVCGWLCPLGFMQDVGERLLTALGVKLRRPLNQPRLVRLALAAMIVGQFAVMPLLAAPVHLWQVDLHFREPWLLGFPFRAGLFALDLGLLFVMLGVVLPLFFGPRAYCKMVCETGYLLDRAGSFAFGRIRRNHGFDQDTCISCRQCTSNCPQGINVYEEVNLFDRVVNTSCITCLRCVSICPNDTIIYSLRKRVADTGKVAGYLASLNVRAADLPRHLLTGAFVLAGGYLGFRVLPTSYFHSYALFASLGGLTGYLVYRGLELLLGGRLDKRLAQRLQADALSVVEREQQERLLPLSTEERMAATETPHKRRYGVIGALITAYALVAFAALGVVEHLPPRITQVSELPADKRDPDERAKSGAFYFGVPPSLSVQDTHRAYGPMHGWLSHMLGHKVTVAGAESYGELAGALEQGRIDAAVLPAGTASALLARSSPDADPPMLVIAQTEIDGHTTYAGAIVTRPGGPSSLAELRGRRLAITSLDSVSGFLAPMTVLREAGLGAKDLSEVIFAGTHQKALALLAAGRVDAAASFDGAIERFSEHNPSVPLVPLRTYDGLLTDLVLVRAGLNPGLSATLKDALLGLHDEESKDSDDVREGLEVGSISRFVPWTQAQWAEFRALYP